MEPAEVHRYPFLSEFLAEWTQVHRPGMELINIVGDEGAPHWNQIRELLDLRAWHAGRAPMSFETSVPGIFAVGDARLGSMKRAASAVGEGASAVQQVHLYMKERRKPAPV
jgi:NADPH-dependent glutamate synthase beta subunit-like oxidoreductase